MKNFRKTFKKFRKNFRAYFQTVIVSDRVGLWIERALLIIVTVAITLVITSHTAELQKERQANALITLYDGYLSECYNDGDSDCHFVFEYEDGIITDFYVEGNYGIYY